VTASPIPSPSSLSRRFRSVRELTETLARPLSAEDQTIQSMPDVSPTKWHRAHTSWFFETFVLGPRGFDIAGVDTSYRYLFNSYYEAVGERHQRTERGLLSRPGVAEITDYRRHVDDAMGALLAAPLDDDTAAIVELGLHHEQQHQELIVMDIKHVLSRHPFAPVYRERPARSAASLSSARANGWIERPGGLVEIGHPGDGFAFDNEEPRHAVMQQPFALADRLVTNREWLTFIDDGGYHRPAHWLSEGWTTVMAQQWEAPLYWSSSDAGWRQFTLAGEQPIDLDEPVCHISLFEADAYARWAGCRLPTEAEWESVASEEPVAGAFLDPGVLQPRPGPGSQLYGTVWQWTSSSYSPYPGFRPGPGAVGEYNGKFMINQYVLRGGSCATPLHHVRPTYRNFFPASARWAFSGLRLANDA
jgi:ergothioneine biosynthesis protein EgtB